MKNRGSTPDFNKLSRGPPKKHPHKFRATVQELKKFTPTTATTTTDTG